VVGLERDRHVLDRFARYSHEQGLARQVWAPEQIVPAGASDSFGL
jgi:4,5-dihydroxyphthalate decarboxylase